MTEGLYRVNKPIKICLCSGCVAPLLLYDMTEIYSGWNWYQPNALRGLGGGMGLHKITQDDMDTVRAVVLIKNIRWKGYPEQCFVAGFEENFK